LQRFDGDMPREYAETLAADIAAYLEYRKQCTTENTDNTDNTQGSTSDGSMVNTKKIWLEFICRV